ncbi:MULTISPECIES: hypothetical protein [Cryobacterium]|uniref:FUSC family protein n=1 Tax=Cryobacterium breve TaxID=1259258 RepID=A0ABY2J316_9MICO|nr:MULTISPECIES: hypothetical protein [Cryobacterium]TFC91897.1 hypothetical protein E3T20_13710 [Cryobacterium sp. TmT3-12]TFC98448.1 hypothetical protein E3O65_08930 [Cryobacterium breve]
MTPWTAPLARRHRWGNYRARCATGLTLVVLGVLATILTSTYSLHFLVAGVCLQLAGWLVLPGALWRRLAVVVPALASSILLLGGADFNGAFAALLACWLLVRHRPWLSYLAVIPSIAMSFLLKEQLNDYEQNWVGYLIGFAIAAAGAWLAWWLAGWINARKPRSRHVSSIEYGGSPADLNRI